MTQINLLYAFAQGKNDKPAPNDMAIASYAGGLAQQLQSRLKDFWLIDNVDGNWGPRSARALENFKIFRGIKEPGLGKATAVALVNTDPSKLIRGWLLDGGWVSRTIMWMVMHNFYISTNPGEINIVYFRGLDRNGTWNGNAPFVFNDRRTIITVSKNKDGFFVPDFKGNWLATCDPGEYYWENPMNDNGCADIKAWQYQSWSVGDHNGQNALVQSDTITVLRGANRVPDTGNDFSVDQHSVAKGEDNSSGDEVGPWSAGCMVGASRTEHDEEFMPLVQSDPREKAAAGKYKHWTAVINGNDFLDMFPG